MPAKIPLQIFVMYHLKNANHKNYFEFVYSIFSRDPSNPLIRGLNIPVYCWFPRQGEEQENMDKKLFGNCEQNIFIAFIDYEMVNDSKWGVYLGKLWLDFKEDVQNHLILVALDNTAFNINEKLKKANFIRFYDFPEENRTNNLIVNLLHELNRILCKKTPLDSGVPLSIKLFLSHSKGDGEEITKLFRVFLYKKTPLRTFFDFFDIPPGYSFDEVIEKNIINTCVIAFQTDQYASRTWCKREVLIAKQNCRPIIVVNCLKSGEERSFPYIGNVPTITWNPDQEDKIIEIIILALRESLRNLYNINYFQYIGKNWALVNEAIPYYCAPELLTCILPKDTKKFSKAKFMIYPDPPLGYEELSLLKKTRKDMEFITPTQFLTKIAAQHCEKDRASRFIGLSISDNPDLPKNGLTLIHLREAFVELARYLLAAQLNLVYGGDLRQHGFTQILFDLTREYSKSEEQARKRVISFISWPFHRDLKPIEQAVLKDIAEIKKIGLPVDLSEFSDSIIDPKNIESNYLCARALTQMREEMNRNVDARVFLGGNLIGFKGIYPGVLEEAYISILQKKPVFLIGCFGGATQTIIDALNGIKHSYFKIQGNVEFLAYYNEKIAHISGVKPIIENEKLYQFFYEKKLEELNNGLSNEENEQLFTTTQTFEIISLVLRGLSNLEMI